MGYSYTCSIHTCSAAIDDPSATVPLPRMVPTKCLLGAQARGTVFAAHGLLMGLHQAHQGTHFHWCRD